MISLKENDYFINLNEYQHLLIAWGSANFRVFPWRMTANPYKILMAEIFLHRTQAKQVVPVYEIFVEKYPTLQSLVKTRPEKLHQVLYPLGLRWRVDLIYHMAMELMTRFGGEIPPAKTDLLSLPGISEYIAGAVRCFAWGIPEPLADTNTVRVAGRLFCLKIKESSRRNRQYKNLLYNLLPAENSRAYNYALLDLADKICIKRNSPDCPNCPLLSLCCFGQTWHGSELL